MKIIERRLKNNKTLSDYAKDENSSTTDERSQKPID
jgi:hypothetical protein